MSEPTSHEKWLRLVAERLNKQQRDYSIANTCEEAADAIRDIEVELLELRAAVKTMREALTELLAVQYEVMPPYEEGIEAQNKWADRGSAARNNAAAALTGAHKDMTGGEK